MASRAWRTIVWARMITKARCDNRGTEDSSTRTEEDNSDATEQEWSEESIPE